jgi:hypothetical protein
MEVKEFEAALRNLIPTKIEWFEKLESGKPYHFDAWKHDRLGQACMYYSFASRDGSRRNRKRVVTSEIRAALQHLRDLGSLDREAFRDACPTSASDGACGFAVVGRILEALVVALYAAGEARFNLTDSRIAAALLGGRE